MSSQGTPPESPPPERVPPVGQSALPPDLMAANASPEDRSTAMIAHLLGLVGFLGPLIIYLVKKDTASRFAQFHMKQSLWFQVGMIVVYFGLMFLNILGGFITGAILSCLLIPLFLLAAIGAIVYVIIGAVQVNGGKDFEYLVIGPWIRQSM